MATAGRIEEMASATAPSSAAPPGQCHGSVSSDAASLGNALHYSFAQRSAAQFNQSVSAMPCHASHGINAPQGTADTLLLRSANPIFA
jgi:hypothetical protein